MEGAGWEDGQWRWGPYEEDKTEPINHPIPRPKTEDGLRVAVHKKKNPIRAVNHDLTYNDSSHAFYTDYKEVSKYLQEKFHNDHFPRPSGVTGAHNDISLHRDSVYNANRARTMVAVSAALLALAWYI